jgi:hypothetical protein
VKQKIADNVLELGTNFQINTAEGSQKKTKGIKKRKDAHEMNSHMLSL